METDNEFLRPSAASGGKKITDFIVDKSLRIRSYLRRRPIPFKRAVELDMQIGTRSLLIQICRDIDECLYVGDDELINQFLSKDGVRLSDVTKIAKEGRIRNDFETYDNQTDNGLDDPDLDDEYSPTVEERKKKERARKREAQQRVSDGEFLRNPNERSKVFKSRKDSLFAKLTEMDTVCGCQSFIIVVSPEKEAAFYQGDAELVSHFFTEGFSSKMIHRDINIRPFETDETDCNICSVPHCIVSRNTLSKWRLAALDMFGFPDTIPMTMYACPEADRDQWMAELDLDPNVTGKITVCSLHFKEGYPTDEYPYPTELLSDNVGEVFFKGSKGSNHRAMDKKRNSSEEIVQGVLDSLMVDVDEHIAKRSTFRYTSLKLHNLAIRKSKKITKLKILQKRNLKKKRSLKQMKSNFPVARKLVNFYKQSLFSSKCKICKRNWKNNKQLFEHFRTKHLGLSVRNVKKEDDEKVMIRLEEAQPVKLNPLDVRQCLTKLYPGNKTATMNPKKKYVCAVCKSHCDLYGLFVHMKQVHKGLLCQYCLKLFKKVEDLEGHLRGAHRIPKKYYHSFTKFSEIAGNKYNFVCGTCNKMVKPFENGHQCQGSLYECPYCDRTFPGSYQLEMHIVNGWCKFINSAPAEAPKLYKVLTGKDWIPSVKASQSLPSKKVKKESTFSVSDRQVLMKYNLVRNNKKVSNFKSTPLIENIPLNGNIFCGAKSRGITNHIKKEIKDNGYKYDAIKNYDVIRAGKNLIVNVDDLIAQKKVVPPIRLSVSSKSSHAMRPVGNSRRSSGRSKGKNRSSSTEDKENFERCTNGDDDSDSQFNGNNSMVGDEEEEEEEEGEKRNNSDSAVKESKHQRIKREFRDIQENLINIRVAIDNFGDKCLVCQQAHVVFVDAVYLLSHLLIIHDKTAVENILKENPQKCINRMKRRLKYIKSKEIIFSYQQDHDLRIDFYSCSYCSTSACLTNEDLFRHLEKDHGQKVLTCNLCQSIFLNYGSFISHVCYGPPTNSQKQKAAKFNCKICPRQDLSSFLIFQNHIRRDHDMCEICFKSQGSQDTLYDHCLRHSQELMCMKCFLTYDEYDQFRKHLFYKHNDESRICLVCHQKTWPHVYHFCIKDLPTTCEVCDKKFQTTKKYRVHIRTHTNVHPYNCTANNCSKSFISKQLLWKHQIRRHPDLSISATKALEDKRNAKEVVKYKASSIQTVRDIQIILRELVDGLVLDREKEESAKEPEEEEKKAEEAEKNEQNSEEKEIDPIQAAVASIMGAEGVFNTKKSPTKPFYPPPPTASPPKPITISLNPTPSSTVMLTPYNSSGGLVAQPPNPPPPPPPLVKEPPKIMHPSEYFSKSGVSRNSDKGSETDDADSDDQRSSSNVSKNLTPASSAPVVGGIWNQDLLFVSNGPNVGKAKVRKPGMNKAGGGLKVMKPLTEAVSSSTVSSGKTFTSLDPNSITKKLGSGGWEVCLSESSDESDGGGGSEKPKKVKMLERVIDHRIPILDHDYCYESYMLSLEPLKPPELSEMDKILSNVALGVSEHLAMEKSPVNKKKQKHKKNKKEGKKKKKKKRKNKKNNESSSDSEGESESRKPTALTSVTTPAIRKTGPKAKFHTPVSGTGGVTAGTGRITFYSSSEDEDDDEDTADNAASAASTKDGIKKKRRTVSNDECSSSSEICSSDLDTDFSADERQQQKADDAAAAVAAAAEAAAASAAAASAATKTVSLASSETREDNSSLNNKPSLKLKIRLPAQQQSNSTKLVISKNRKRKGGKNSSRKSESFFSSSTGGNRPLSKKMRESLALNRNSSSSSASSSRSSSPSSAYSGSDGGGRGGANAGRDDDVYYANKITSPSPKPYIVNDTGSGGSGAVVYHSDPDKLYCVCQCPHDDVSEMIGCDAPDCKKEWFHFECVGILVPPEGKWYCPECIKRYKIKK